MRAHLPALAALAVALAAPSWPSPGKREGYDTPDRARFEAFLDADPSRRSDYNAFVAMLRDDGLADVVPAWQLWRQGTDWRDAREPPFAIPPRDVWPAIEPVLGLVRDELVWRVGPVEVVSGWRTPAFNRKAGGAAHSRHLWFEAVDVVPKVAWLREPLHGVLLGLWERDGEDLGLGLGLYDKIRFHVDTHAYRKW